MPIHVDIFHPDRLVVAIIRGTLTAEEVMQALRDFVASGAFTYKKLIDMSHMNAPVDDEGLQSIAAMLRAETGTNRGPLAFVTGLESAAEKAEKFARLTQADRPVRVFRSLHEARNWLNENYRP